MALTWPGQPDPNKLNPLAPPTQNDPPGWILKQGQLPQQTGHWGVTMGAGDLKSYTDQLNRVLAGLRTAAGAQ